jgi:hypothetical protein
MDNKGSHIDRVQSPLSNFTYQVNNIGGVPPGTSLALSDGFWVMLRRLAAEEQVIQFSGVVVDLPSKGTNNFVTDVTYYLTVSNNTTRQTSPSSLGNTTTTTATNTSNAPQ